MKIIHITAHQPVTPDSPPDWRTQLGQIVVEIQTDDGRLGIGVGGGGAAAIHVIETVLSDLLLGCDATDVEELHAKMLRHTSFYGRKGIVIMAISGVDLALWDLRGKRAGKPVAKLLNPNADVFRDLPTYCTVFDNAGAETAIHAGHQAIKLQMERFGNQPDPTAIHQHVRDTRDRLGSTARIMIDAFGRWNLKSTLEVANAISEFNIEWLEEPLLPDDRVGYQKLAERCPIPIAGGEHEYTADGFHWLIDDQLHTILQPDINWCGGMTTLLQIYKMAASAGIRVCPHRGCEPFALAAIASLDPQPLAESGRRWFTCLTGVPEIQNGKIHVVDRPGFGVGLKQDDCGSLEKPSQTNG